MRVPLHIYFAGFLGGILAWILLANIFVFSLLGLVFLLCFFCLFVLISYFLEKYFCSLFCVLLVGFSLGLGISYVSFVSYTEQLQDLSIYTDEYYTYTSKVLSVHKRDTYEDTYLMALYSIENTRYTWVRHLLTVPKNFSLQYGDKVSLRGKMYFFEDFDGVSYQKYMLSQRIYFSLRASHIHTQENIGNYFFGQLFSLRDTMLLQIHSLFPRKEAIFLAGILIGAREDIPDELSEDFNKSWLTHFIAVSGFNISLCVIFIVFLVQYFPPWIQRISVTLCVTVFTIFVWMWAPVVRAGIMGVLGYIFLQSGNKVNSLVLLLFAAVCMSIYSPLSLNYDVSMHLSFLAVLGIILTQGFFMKIFSFVPQSFALREALVLTCSAFVLTLPIMLFQFGQFTALAPISNVLVAWTIPLAMLLWACTLIADAIWWPLGFLFAYTTWLLLHYDMIIVEFFGNLEWAVWQRDFWLYKSYFQALYFIVIWWGIAYFYLQEHLRNKT